MPRYVHAIFIAVHIEIGTGDVKKKIYKNAVFSQGGTRMPSVKTETGYCILVHNVMNNKMVKRCCHRE